jgi:hypothetical protein
MKKKHLVVLIFAVFTFFSASVRGFSQQLVTVEDIAEDLDDLKDDISGALSFASSIGLNWPDVYIGPLINIPPHWGVGLTMGTTMLKLDKLNVFLSKFGYEADTDFMYKQLFPAYTLEARIGGSRLAPFDIGIKWGWVPYVEIFKNSINYENCLYGIDFRWELLKDWFKFPAISIGLEVDHTTGGIKRETAVSITGGSTSINVGGSGTAGVVWDSWVFDLKLNAAKRFWEPRLTIYGGLRIGCDITKTGYQLFGGEDISVNTGGTAAVLSDLNRKGLSDLASSLESESGHGITFEVTEDSITGWINAVGFNLSIYEGISFNFENNTHLSVSLMADLVHFELGANIGFRFQQ